MKKSPASWTPASIKSEKTNEISPGLNVEKLESAGVALEMTQKAVGTPGNPSSKICKRLLTVQKVFATFTGRA